MKTESFSAYSISIDDRGFARFTQLCEAMAKRHIITLYAQGTLYTGYINGIQTEDNSGYKWIVTINNESGSRTVFVKAN